jgi:peptidoglycan hydrolase-like protein with peptidoglycan-binding domain
MAGGAATAVGDAASSAWNTGTAAVGGAVSSASTGVTSAGRATSEVVNNVASVAQGALLRPGTTGGAVATIQKLLSSVSPGVPLSGVFDAGTGVAVKAFQAAQGLSADGVVGPKTLQALNAATLITKVRSSVPSFSPEQVAILRRLHAGGTAAKPGDMTAATVGAVPLPPTVASGQSTGAGQGGGTACAYQQCPAGEEIPATPDISSSAERCIQAHYRSEHSGSTVSSNKDYVFLTGRDPREKDALNCMRKHFTAKSGTHPGEPDIWDFTNNTMYEVTTKNGAAFRKPKLVAELVLANKIAADRECGGQFYGPGNWAPAGPCISLGGTGAFMSVRNEAGVLIYTPFRPKKKEQEQEVPATDKKKQDELEEKLKQQLATLALAAAITLAVALVIVLIVIGVITAPAWVPAVLAGLGLAAVIALVAGLHDSPASAA